MTAAGQPSLAELEKKIDDDLKPRSRELTGWTLTAKIDIEGEKIETKNVVGVLEGAGPHADETVVIGGHYDHLGHGGHDLGVAGVLLERHPQRGRRQRLGNLDGARAGPAAGCPPRPAASPGRLHGVHRRGDAGCFGSQYYVEHPLFPLDETVMMINCDMVGRLNDKSELTMIGTGTTPGIDALVDVLGKSAGLKIKKVAGMTDGFGGSDHESFYPKGIPVLFAFTGLHADYHRPSDDSDRINYAGMARIADYLELIVLDVAGARIGRRSSRSPNGGSPRGGDTARRGTSVSLGIMPDYAYEDKDGLRITGVRDGGPGRQGRPQGRRSHRRCGSQAGRNDLRLHGKHDSAQARATRSTWW